MVDRNGLLQVILNLLANAGQAFSDEAESRRVAIVIEAGPEPGQVSLSVGDNGPGVDPDDVSRLFEPYFTRKEPGRGTGLGLAISLSIVQNYGGSLEYFTSDEGGALFRLTLVAAPR